MVGVPELAQALVVRLGPAALAGDTRIVAPVIARRGLAGTAVGHRRRHGMAVHDMEGLIGGCFPPDTEAGLRRMSPGASLSVGQTLYRARLRPAPPEDRPEERRVGNECVSQCRLRGSPLT